MIIEKWCPECIAACIRPILLKINKGKRKNESSGIQELEEEEFQMRPDIKPPDKHNKSGRSHKSGSIMNVDDEESVNLSMKMNLGADKEEEAEILIPEQEENPHLENFHFSLNLESYDEHYTLLESKTSNLEDIFNSHTTPVVNRHTKACVKIGEIQSVIGFKMLVHYRLPCSYDFYRRVNGDYTAVCTLNPIITANRIEETLQPNLTLNHLSFKKFMLLQPRFFHYLKYHNSSQNQHWEVTTSVRGRPESEPSAKECQLTTITCLEQRGSHSLAVHSYLWVDAKSNIKARKVVERVYQEVANYIDNLYEYSRRNYRPEEEA